MSITNGPNLGLMVHGNAGEAHYSEMMALLRGLDGLVMPRVTGYLINTPPASPADGDCYIIGAAPTGAWAGQAGKVTRYSTVAAAWEFFTPKNGWILQANSARESYRYTASAWEIYYQEGTWTPQLVGRTTPGTQTYSLQAGSYAKIGRMCFASFDIGISSFSGAAGTAQVGGLPYTVGVRAGVAMGSVRNITFPAGCTSINCYATPAENNLILTQVGSGIGLNLDASAITATTYLSGTASYAI